MALKTMAEITHNASEFVTRSDHQPPSQTDLTHSAALRRCAIHHRIGSVPVGEPSIGAFRHQHAEIDIDNPLQSLLFLVRTGKKLS